MVLTKLMKSENAVSEILGYITVIGIMLVAISVIVVSGYPAIEKIQDTGHQENIRQSFVVMSSSFDKLFEGSAPSKSVEMKLYDSEVAIRGSSYINITSTTSDGPEHYERQLRMVEINYRDNSLAYENTGVWEKDGYGNTQMISSPNFVLTDDSMIIPVMLFTGTQSISGQSVIRIVAESGSRSVIVHQDVSSVSITLVSEYYRGWARYFEDEIGMSVAEDSENESVYAYIDELDGIDVYILYIPNRLAIEQ